MNRNYLIIIFGMIFFAYACTKDAVTGQFIGFSVPAGFPSPEYHFATNPVTKEGFELGRKLFYDTRLSGDNSISCSSCHIQTSAFTHHGHSLSHGIADRVGTRNSPPIMNMAWNTSFMWDGGVFDLDLQAIAPITNHVEMDESMANIMSKLRSSSDYPNLFEKAFGSPEINTANFLKALSQFMLMCVSSNSKYDSVMRQAPGKSFTTNENAGYTIFRDKCGSCHREPLFTDHSFRNNGLSSTLDEGRYLITQHDTDRYKFKVPSLRNLAYTAPYMHDGRFLTVDAVLEHYDQGMERTPTLDPVFQAQARPGIRLSVEEKKALMAFLETLNDRSFLFNQSLSAP